MLNIGESEFGVEGFGFFDFGGLGFDVGEFEAEFFLAVDDFEPQAD